ncbi:RagB/SusD family nutrient uptake outer membrane protein [Flagellimonas sp. 2504JD4-2]
MSFQGPVFNQRGFVGLSEVSSDATIVPSRPGWGWEDGGSWIRLSEHSWTPNHLDLSNFYSDMFSGIARANSFIFNIENSDAQFNQKEELIAEARVLRAYFYLILLDMYGNVPIVTEPLRDSDQPPSNDNASNRSKLAQFVVDELNEAMQLLPNLQRGENFGRVSQDAAKMMLAKLYLNSNIYFETGVFSDQNLDLVINLTSDIINSGSYSLITPYIDTFNTKNELDNPESIFAIRFDPVSGAGNVVNQISLNAHPDFTTISPWGGFVVTADIVNSFEVEDNRLEQIVVDTIFDANGLPFSALNFITGEEEIVIHDRNLTDPLRTAYFDGARILKWNEDPNIVGSDGGNDFLAIRLSEAYTMRAEANLRLGNSELALTDINIVRARAFEPDNPLSAIDLDILLKELGREFVYEGHRRTDLIRFGKWTDAWQFKDTTDNIRGLFPIPQTELDANPNLTQNPGY